VEEKQWGAGSEMALCSAGNERGLIVKGYILLISRA
jgi:hypothetical protein